MLGSGFTEFIQVYRPFRVGARVCVAINLPGRFFSAAGGQQADADRVRS